MITFRLAPHAVLHRHEVIEVLEDGVLVGTLYAGRDTGVTLSLVSKHEITASVARDVVKDDLAVLTVRIRRIDRKASPVVVRTATDDEQRQALIAHLRDRVARGEATHDCGEWVVQGRCGLCDRVLD